MSKAAHRATKMRTEKQPLAMAIESVNSGGVVGRVWVQEIMGGNEVKTGVDKCF